MKGMIPPKPIPMKDRASFVHLGPGRIESADGALVHVSDLGEMPIPIGGIACVLLEPGTVVTHAAIKVAAWTGTLFVWVGEGGVRLYSAGHPGGRSSARILHQASLVLDERKRLDVVRRMYAMRFGEEPPERRSIDQLRGMEAVRVKELYRVLAARHGLKWHGRDYKAGGPLAGDPANVCMSAGTSCLYGLAEAAIIAVGYSPAIGFLHVGKSRSFAFDIADIVKFETVVPAAFSVAAKGTGNLEGETRRACRDLFRKTKLLDRLVGILDQILDFKDAPVAQPEAMPVAFEEVDVWS